MKEACQNCRYWVAKEDVPREHDMLPPEYGECRRNAPTGMGITVAFATGQKAQRYVTVAYPFPPTYQDDWCAQYGEAG